MFSLSKLRSILISCAMFVFLLISSLRAQDYSFTTLDPNGLLPSIASNNLGLTIAVWQSTKDELFYAITEGGGVWQTPVSLNAIGEAPAVALDDDNNAVIAWVHNTKSPKSAQILSTILKFTKGSPTTQTNKTVYVDLIHNFEIPKGDPGTTLVVSGQEGKFGLIFVNTGIITGPKLVLLSTLNLSATSPEWTNFFATPAQGTPSVGSIDMETNAAGTRIGVASWTLGRKANANINYATFNGMAWIPGASTFPGTTSSVGIDNLGNYIVGYNETGLTNSTVFPIGQIQINKPIGTSGAAFSPAIATNKKGFSIAAWSSSGNVVASYLNSLNGVDSWIQYKNFTSFHQQDFIFSAVNKRGEGIICWTTDNATGAAALFFRNVFISQTPVPQLTGDSNFQAVSMDGRGNGYLIGDTSPNRNGVGVATFVAKPIVETITPDVGVLGSSVQVTIKGRRFNSNTSTQVLLNGVPLSSSDVTVVSNKKITAVFPEEVIAGTVSVQVQTSQGTSAINDNSKFYFVTETQPTVTSLTPDRGPIAGGTPVTILGTNFTNDSVVRFGTQTASSTFISATQINAISPMADKAEVVSVVVTNTNGSSPPSQGSRYFYQKD